MNILNKVLENELNKILWKTAFKKIERKNIPWFNGPYHLNFLKAVFHTILIGSFLNTA